MDRWCLRALAPAQLKRKAYGDFLLVVLWLPILGARENKWVWLCLNSDPLTMFCRASVGHNKISLGSHLRKVPFKQLLSSLNLLYHVYLDLSSVSVYCIFSLN